MKNDKLVSVIIPCLNEENSIEKCLSSIANSDYPLDLIEVLVIDGYSTDKTLQIVDDFQRNDSLKVIVLYNEAKQQNLALNIGIDNAHGEIILRLDAHATIATNYIKESVDFLLNINPEADAVGAPIKTKAMNSSIIGNGIALVMSSKFGVGSSSFRTSQSRNSNKIIATDSIPYGCYKKEVFNEIGKYNEELFCTEDLDFHYRMKKAGKNIFINYKIFNIYHSRNSFFSFIKQTFRNGRWSILPIAITGTNIFSIKHIIPLIFTLSIILLAVLSTNYYEAKILLYIEIIFYIIIALFFSIINSYEHKNIFLLILLPPLYCILHFVYGLGSLSALPSLLQIKK